MEDIVTQFRNIRALPLEDKLVNLIDILLVAFIIYRLLMLVRGTQGWRIFIGIVSFLIVFWLSHVLHLDTLYWLLDKVSILVQRRW